jgi:hypothetical protein
MSSELIKPPSKDILERVRSEFGLNEERVREAVEHLKDWIQLQPHLPKEISKLRIFTPQPCNFHNNTHNPLLNTNSCSPQTIFVSSWTFSSL